MIFSPSPQQNHYATRIRTNKEQKWAHAKALKRKTKNFVDRILRDEYSEAEVLRTIEIKEGVELKLVDQGLDKPNDVILYQDGKAVRTLFTSSDDPNRSSVSSITKIWTDPLKLHAIVPVAYQGSIDQVDLYVIDIGSGEVIKRIEK